MEAFRDKLGSSDEGNTVAKKEGRHLSKCMGYKPTPEVTPHVISFLKCRPYDKLRRNTWLYVKKSADHTPLSVREAGSNSFMDWEKVLPYWYWSGLY